MAEDNFIPQPWLRHPEFAKGSMAWRMGAGDYYDDWRSRAPADEADRLNELFPEPLVWSRSPGLDGFAADRRDGVPDGSGGVVYWIDYGAPKYSLKDIRNSFRSGRKMDFIFFGEGVSGEAACLSQFYPAAFNRENHFFYHCAEQYMMAEKALLFRDEETLAEIMNCRAPVKIKKLGRKVKNFDAALWDECKHSVVLNGNYQKFMQNEKLREYLLRTGDSVLVEANPHDNIWGIGTTADDPGARNPLAWKGRNMLGFALMEARDEIRRVWGRNGSRF